MKYLKKYKYFENANFNLCNVQNTLKLEEFNDIMIKCCKNVDLEKDTPILRCVNSELEKDFYIVDHRKIERQSSNTSNYYTLIMDNSEKWKDYPKRKNSVVCSLNDSYMGNDYRVIPLNNYDDILKKYNINTFSNPKWGVCPTIDLWDSFHISMKEIGIWNENLDTINFDFNEIYKNLNHNKSLEEKDYSYLKIQLSSIKIDKIKNAIRDREGIRANNSIFDIIENKNNIKMNDWSLYDIYEYILDPVKNGFKIETYDNLKKYSFKKDNEVWTNTPVLYIKIE